MAHAFAHFALAARPSFARAGVVADDATRHRESTMERIDLLRGSDARERAPLTIAGSRWRRVLASALVALMLLAATPAAFALNVAIYRGAGVQPCLPDPGPADCEPYTLQQSAIAAGHTVTAFTAPGGAPDWATALAGQDVLIIPDQEDFSGGSNFLSQPAQAAVRTEIIAFVTSGGGLVQHADGGTNDTQLINLLFGWSVTNGGIYSSNTPNFFTRNDLNAAGTPFASGPSGLPDHNGSYVFPNGSLPAASSCIYERLVTSECALFIASVGIGRVVVHAFDGFEAAPVGSQSAWLGTQANGIAFAGAAFPTSTTLTTAGQTTPGDPTPFGEPVVLTATVTNTDPVSIEAPSGNVVFADENNVVLGTVSLAPFGAPAPGATQARATLQIAPPALGTLGYDAFYNTTANFVGSNDGDPHTVVRAGSITNIALIAPPGPVVGATTTITVSVSANPPGAGTPTGSVVITGLDTAGCTVTLSAGGGSCPLTFTAKGVKPILATYSGDTFFEPSVDNNDTVNVQGIPTSLTITSTVANPSFYGNSFVVNYLVTGGSSPYDGNVLVDLYAFDPDIAFRGAIGDASCSGPVAPDGTGSCTISTVLPVGEYEVEALYTGDSTDDVSGTTTQFLHEVVQATTSLVLSLTPPATAPAGATVTANLALSLVDGIGPLVGSITVSDGGTLCTIPVPGPLTCNFDFSTTGAKTLVATFTSTDANVAGDESDTVPYNVTPAATTTTITGFVPATPQVGDTVRVNFTVSDGLPPHTGGFVIEVAGVTAGCAVFSFDPGTGVGFCDILPIPHFQAVGSPAVRVAYNGDPSEQPSEDTEIVTVVARSTTTSFTTTPGSPQQAGTPITFDYTISGVGGTFAPGTFPTGAVQVWCLTGPAGAGCPTIVCAAPLPAGASGTSTGTCTQTFRRPGVFNFEVRYLGGPNFAPSTSPSANFTIDRATTTIAITNAGALAASTDVGEPVTVAFDVDGGASLSGIFYSGLVEVTATLASPALSRTCQAAVDPNTGVGSCLLQGPQRLSNSGSWQVTARYVAIPPPGPGDINDTDSISAVVAHPVVAADTTTTLDTAPDPSRFGQAWSLLATVTVDPPGIGPAVGSVEFFSGTTSLGIVPLNASGTANLAGPPLNAGTFPFSAVFLANPNFNTSVDSDPHTVTAADVSVAVSSTPNPSVAGQAVTFTATVTTQAPGAGTPVGSVTFTAPGGHTCTTPPLALFAPNVSTASCDITTFSEPETLTVTGNYAPANANFNPASGTTSQTIDRAPATITIGTITPASPRPAGTTISVPYTVSGGFGGNNGFVNMTAVSGATSVPLCVNAAASNGPCTNELTVPGTYTITADYNTALDDTNDTSDTDTASYTIVLANTTLSLSFVDLGAPGTVAGETVRIAASLTGSGTLSPSGTITITRAGNPVCTIAAPGGTCDVTFDVTGLLTIDGNYPGDSFFNPASDSEDLQVDPAPTTTTITNIVPAAPVVGEQVTISFNVAGRVAPDTGTVDLNSTLPGAVLLCDDVALSAGGAGQCTYTFFDAESYTIVASYSGDANDAPSDSAPTSFTVGEAPTALALAQSTGTSEVGQSVVFTATLTVLPPGGGAPGLDDGIVVVRDASSLVTLCTIPAADAAAPGGDTCDYTYTVVGTTNVEAFYAESESNDYLGSQSTPPLVHLATPAATSIVITGINPPGQDIGFPVTLSFDVNGGFGPTFDGTVTVIATQGATTRNCTPLDFDADLADGTGTCTFLATDFQTAGPWTFTASFVPSPAPGTDDGPSTTNAPYVFGRGESVVTFSVAPPTQQFAGDPITFTASVEPDNGNVSTAPTGAIAIVYDGDTLCTIPVPGPGNCVAQIDLPDPGFQFEAAYSGDANFDPDSEFAPYAIVRAPTTITVDATTPSPSVTGQPVAVAYTVSGGNGPNEGIVTVTATLGAFPPVTCTAPAAAGTCTLTPNHGGTWTINAAYDFATDPNDDSSTTQLAFSHLVNRAVTTTTVVVSPTPQSEIGQPVTITATVTVNAPGGGIPQGQFEFFDGLTAINLTSLSPTGTATFTTSSLSLGLHTLRGVFTSTADYVGSNGDQAHTIVPATTTTAITAITPTGPNARIGEPVTVAFDVDGGFGPGYEGTVTVSATNGSATATCSPVTFNAARPPGTGTCTFAEPAFQFAGSWTFTATFVPGAGSDDAGSFGTASYALDRGTSVTTLVVAPTSPQQAGAPVTFTATVIPGDGDVTTARTGTITVLDDLFVLCTITLPDPSCTYTFNQPDLLTLSAAYSGDANFDPSASAPQSYEIVRAETTTTVTAIAPTSVVVGQSFTTSFDVDGQVMPDVGPAGTVSLVPIPSGSPFCGPSSLAPDGTGTCTHTPFAAGPIAFRAEYSGDSNDLSSFSAPQSITVGEAATTLTLAQSTTTSTVGDSVSFTAQLSVQAPGGGTPTGAIVVSSSFGQLCTIDASAATASGGASCSYAFGAVGTFDVTATYADGESPNYLGSTSNTVSHEVTAAPTFLAMSVAATTIGEPVTVSFTLTGGFGPTFDGTIAVSANPGAIACDPVSFDNDRPTGTGSCTFPAATFQTAGNYTFIVEFLPAGPTSDDGPSSSSQTVTVNRGATVASLTIVPSSTQVVGQLATFQVLVTVPDTDISTLPTGAITVFDSLTFTPICFIALPATECTHSFDFPATLSVVANYSGDDNFTGDSSDSQEYTITAAPTQVAISGIANSPSVVGETVTVSFAVTGGHLGNDGLVTIDSGPSNPTCSASAGTGSCQLTFTQTGPYSLTANYAGDANDLSSTSSPPFPHVVNQAPTALSLVQSAAVAQIGQSVDFTVDLDVVAPGAGAPQGNVVVFYGTTTICTVTAVDALDGATCGHVFTALGTVEVAAVYGEAEDTNFGASADDVSHETIPADTFIDITAITPIGVRIGDPVSLAFEITGGYGATFDGTVTVSASNGASCSPSFTNTRPTGSGSCTFAAGAFQLAGSYDFTVAFVPGAGSDDAASQDTDSFAIDRGTTTTTLSISPSGQQFAGSGVDFTVNVARNDGDVTTAVTGSVAVTDGATPICTITLPATSCTVAFPTPRTLNAVATYSGDANFEGSASAPQSYLIEFVPTTTTITADTPDPTVTGEPFTVSYEVSGGFDGNDGNVTVTATGPATYTCTNPAASGSCVITPFRAGNYVLTASYAGDANDAGSSTVSGTPHVVNRATTTLVFTVSPSPQVFGETVTLTATVTANAPGAGVPQGTVVFLDNGASFAEVPLDASGVAVFTTSSFSIGTHPLRADFAQTADYLQSFFDVNHEVLRYPTTTTITSDAPDPSVAGEPVVVQYAVASTGGTPTGNVTVTATPGGQTCTASVATGQCTLTFATAVNRTLVAAYAGDSLNQPSTSANEPHTVNRADTLVTITSDTPDPTAANQPYTVAVSVAAVAPGAGTPSGTVAVSDGTDGCSITLAGGTGSCSMASTTPGNKTLTATYAGDADFNGNSDTEPHEVLRIVTTTTLAPPTPVVVGQTATFVYTVTSADGSTATGAVSVVDTADSSVVCTGSVAAGQCQAAFPSAGTRTLRAEYAGDATHAPSNSGTQSLAVNQASTTTTITSDSPDPSEVTTPYTVAVSVTVNAPGAGTPGGTITVSDGTDSCTITLPAASCALTSTTLGTKTLTATYAGDASFSGSSGTATHEVVRIATTTTITGAAPAPSVTGQAVVFSYTVATGTGTATGNVTLTAAPGGATCTDTVAAGQCTITFASAGARTVTATYGGDATHATSTSAPFGHTVNAAATTTTIDSDSPDPSEVGQGYVVQVTVAPVAPGAGLIGGTVAVSDGTDGCSITLVAGIGQCVLTSTTAGGKTLTATYAGTADFASSSGTATHTVNAMSTTTTLAVAPGTVVVGQPVTFTYTVTPATGPAPTGTVTVTNTADSSVVCSGTVAAGSCSASFASVGTRSVRASYGGDATHAPSQSSVQTVTVNQAATTLTITSDAPDPSAVNSPYSVAFTLAVAAPGAGTPTGSVTVSDGSASCTATLPATSCSLTSTTVGGKTLTATYGGDANFTGSSDDESHLVVQGTTTTTITSDDPDPSVTGQAVTIAYTVAPAGATGTVTVTASSGESCSAPVATGQCVITFATAGTRNLTAVYGGDANNAGSSSAPAAHIVNAAATTTTITSDTPDPSAVEQAVTWSVTVTTNAPGAGTPTGSVTIGPVGERCTATLSSGSGSCTITYLTAAPRSVTATYAGNADFAASTSAAEPHTVGTRGTVVSIVSDAPDRSTPTQPVTVVVSFGLEELTGQVDAPTGAIQISDGVDSCQIVLPATSCTLTLTSRGPRTLTATYPGDANYDPSSDTESHLVNRLPASVDDAYTTPQGATLVANDATGTGTPGNANDNGVLANDGDADGDTLTVANPGALTAGGFGGSVTLGSTGTFTYVPPASGAGTATFPVQVSDGYETFTTTSTITVQGVVDLAISKTNNSSLSGYGDTVTYVIVVSNVGGSAVVGATVQDLLPSSLGSATWTCSGTGGGICPASGSGDINRLVDLPTASTVTFVLTATVQPGFSGLLTNTATVSVPASQVDAVPGNNTATDNDDVRTFRDGFE